jgi:hypothetical protein
MIVGAGILLSALLISSVASTWAQYRQQVAVNDSINPNIHRQYMNGYDSTIPKINGSVKCCRKYREHIETECKDIISSWI